MHLFKDLHMHAYIPAEGSHAHYCSCAEGLHFNAVHIAISDDISSHDDFQVDGCRFLLISYPHSKYIAGRDNDQ